MKKKKTATVNKVMDRLSKIKQAIGGDNINVDDKTIERVFGDSLLNDDFDDADWDNKMAEILMNNIMKLNWKNQLGMMMMMKLWVVI